MKLYNSLTRKKEEFVPLRPGKVHMYVCGITAYDFCHVGHARSALVFDVLARYLRFTGLELFFARNFTDVDDKIIKRAHDDARDWREVARTYMRCFHEDMDLLGVLRADAEPKATDYIGEMQALCEELIRRNKAYATPSGDVYFRVRAFPEYGKLSGRSPDELRAGARVAPGEEKDDPLDFALWKAAKPGEPFWESPWGNGRPGWHIECSAMSAPHQPLDIHGGGLDLIFPHHENEIAQSEGAGAQQMARFWVHNGFVQVDSEKMSKSLGNFTTIRDILKRCLPETLRFFLLGKHYRSPVDFSFDSMDEAEKAQKRVYQTLVETRALLDENSWRDTPFPAGPVAEVKQIEAAFAQALEDDLNTASAIGQIFALVRVTRQVLEDKKLRSSEGAREIFAAFLRNAERWRDILGLFGSDAGSFLQSLRARQLSRKGIDLPAVEKLLEKRKNARQNKDFAASDALRGELAALGIEVRDSPEGQQWDVAL
ncbi:MAG: cysteine--tRNA ligase [Deltaproteobacteria bacterium]|jgi:cysteinyl-tRNA synthetase|nr:cysteine--tRNA ligase [Deltaproteobacteria bacterium]